jgi:hypothetical protein
MSEGKKDAKPPWILEINCGVTHKFRGFSEPGHRSSSLALIYLVSFLRIHRDAISHGDAPTRHRSSSLALIYLVSFLRIHRDAISHGDAPTRHRSSSLALIYLVSFLRIHRDAISHGDCWRRSRFTVPRIDWPVLVVVAMAPGQSAIA